MGFWSKLLDAIRPAQTGGFKQPPGPPIPWQPNTLSPVFWGYRDYYAHGPVFVEHAAPGAVTLPVPTPLPSNCRIYYPSLDGTPHGAAILTDCGLYPLIVFAHGSCPADRGAHAQYRRWDVVLGQLARCGYVIVAPELPVLEQTDTPPEFDDYSPVLLAEMVAWMRTDWDYAATLAENATGIAGWSYGGGLAAKYTAANPAEIAAVATLSAPSESQVWWTTIQAPKLLMWGTGNASEWESPLADDVWDELPTPKHRAVFPNAHHIDYLPAGSSACEATYGRGPCALQPELTAELLMMFFGRYLTPAGAPDLPDPN